MTKRSNGIIERLFDFQLRTEQGEGLDSPELWVEGYAVRFNSPTVLWEWGDVQYKEQIDRNAFNDCQMSDVIFNYNHSGKVMARTRNSTLTLSIDDEGLFIRARLDGTEEGRKLYEEIKGGYIDRMSFRFKIRQEAYNSEEHLWTVQSIKRLYDVSAVDLPAYDDTSIEARQAEILEANAQEGSRSEGDLETEAQGSPSTEEEPLEAVGQDDNSGEDSLEAEAQEDIDLARKKLEIKLKL